MGRPSNIFTATNCTAIACRPFVRDGLFFLRGFCDGVHAHFIRKNGVLPNAVPSLN